MGRPFVTGRINTPEAPQQLNARDDVRPGMRTIT
jgi:hypothetical protein